MKSIKINLDGHPIKLTPQFYGQSFAWHLRMEKEEGMIKRDTSGAWMQRSQDNLSPEIVSKVGQLIDNKFFKEGINLSE